MSDYTKATNFTAKDSLPTGNSGKIVKGAEIDTELTAIASAIASKSNINSPTFTGTPAAPTATTGSNTTQIATTAYVKGEIDALNAGTIITQDSDDVSITGGSITGITDLAVADGGTGASNASGARTNLGVAIGTDVMAHVAPSTAGNQLVSNGSAWTSVTPPFTKSAWLYYDGGIISSYNIASVTNPGTGLYTITFTNAFSDDTYMALGTGHQNSSGTTQGIAAVSENTVTKTGSTLQISRARVDNGSVESGPFYFYFFGN